MSQMGKIIGAVMAKADGLDGSVVSKLVRKKFNKITLDLLNIL